MTLLDNLRISHKVIAALAILAIVDLAATLYSARNMETIDVTYAALVTHQAAAIRDTARANQRLVNTIRLMYQVIAESDEDEMRDAHNHLGPTRQEFLDLAAQAAAEAPDLKDDFSAVVKKYESAYSQAQEVLDLAHRQKREQATDLMRNLVNPQLEEARLSMIDVVNKLNTQMTNDAKAAHSETSTTILGTLIGVGIGIVASFALALFITNRGISRPLNQLGHVMDVLAGGNYAVDVNGQTRKDEIGAMARSVVVFKENGLAVQRSRQEQEATKLQAEKDRRQAVLTLADSFDAEVKSIVNVVSAQANELQTTATTLSTVAEKASAQSTTVASAAELASANVQTVAAAAEELAASIREISRQVSQSSDMSQSAVEEARRTNQIVSSLADAARRIGDVVSLISDVASQTNLLALNATIEAARAGDAGKGFAVVANEVKTLANQTARATQEISQHVHSIQDATQGAVDAIEGIARIISEINSVATGIASAVEEQGAATQEIARNVQQAATGTEDVSGNIVGVQQAAHEAGQGSGEVLSAARDLSEQTNRLRDKVDQFIDDIRKG